MGAFVEECAGACCHLLCYGCVQPCVEGCGHLLFGCCHMVCHVASHAAEPVCHAAFEAVGHGCNAICSAPGPSCNSDCSLFNFPDFGLHNLHASSWFNLFEGCCRPTPLDEPNRSTPSKTAYPLVDAHEVTISP